MLLSLLFFFFFGSLSSSCAALQERGGLSSGMSPSRHTSSSCSILSLRHRQCSLFPSLFSCTGRERVSEEKATLWTPPAVPSPFLPPALHNNRRGGRGHLFSFFLVSPYVCVRACICVCTCTYSHRAHIFRHMACKSKAK